MAGKTPGSHFTEPTTDFWQDILHADSTFAPAPYQFSFPASLPNGSFLKLPIRPLKSTPDHAVASLLINHASFEVAEALESELADLLRPFNPDIVIGLPTLGLGPAASIAKKLGHCRYVPLGYSRKFWYDNNLSTLLSSITSPLGEKRVFLDPNLLPVIKGKKVAIIDDAVSSGTTMKAAWDLLESEAIGCEVIACGVLMKQGKKWEEVLGTDRCAKLVGVFESPLLKAVDGGWDLRE